MVARLTANLLILIQDAALHSFWRKPTLRTFLRRTGVPVMVLSSIPEEMSKRDLLNYVVPKLEGTISGKAVLLKIAKELANQKAFPDLMGWENTKELLDKAKRAVASLKSHLDEEELDRESEEQAKHIRERALKERETTIQTRLTLESLRGTFDELAMKQLGTTPGGFAFERWLFDLVGFSEIEHRRPYRLPDGHQIDGSITLDGTTYIVEAKFEGKPTDHNAVAVFLKKVHDKADNTMGIVVAVSGFTDLAKKDASGTRSPLLLFEAEHLYHVLSGQMLLSDMIRRVRRHSSQVGEAHLPLKKFSG